MSNVFPLAVDHCKPPKGFKFNSILKHAARSSVSLSAGNQQKMRSLLSYELDALISLMRGAFVQSLLTFHNPNPNPNRVALKSNRDSWRRICRSY